ncbi:hypothetical protein IJI91_03000 [Candidatus Saccharibacteria bacterium]|nr:hypothetical protein [Candidatus Saccharibacteria bacterium]
MAKENISNNNSAVGDSSNNPPADLSYKSQNIVSSKSHKKKSAEFAKDKPSTADHILHRLHLDKISHQKLIIIAVAVIVVFGSGIAFGIGILIDRVNNQSTDEIATGGSGSDNYDQDDYTTSSKMTDEQDTSFDEMIADIENLKNEQITAAEAEADATNDSNKKAEAFYKRINQMLEQGAAQVAGRLIEEGDAYFANDPAGLLAMYKGINYEYLAYEGSLLPYYEKIMQLAKQLGDDKTISEWQGRYNEAKTLHDNYQAAGEEE